MFSINRYALVGPKTISLLVTGAILMCFTGSASAQQPGKGSQPVDAGVDIEILPSASGPPAPIAELEQELGKKIPPPPARATTAQLLDAISKRPGQDKRIDAARRGMNPRKVQSRATSSTTFTLTAPASPFSATLTSQVDGYGRHLGLRTPDGSAYAYLYGAIVSYTYPSNSYVYLRPGTTFDNTITNPIVYLYVRVPQEGYYTINMTAYVYSDVQFRDPGSSKATYTKLLDEWPGAYGWGDFASVQYLSAGSHVLYYVLTGGGYVSRLTVDAVTTM